MTHAAQIIKLMGLDSADISGALYVLENPTDFGLVSMETMFEFAEWCYNSDWDYYPPAKQWFGNPPLPVTTPELFQLFTTQNKEK
jgi:hypothetical protein